MVDEKDEAYGQEEGEYHFSDEHASYEVETENVKVDTTAKSAGAAMAGFTQYRRMIIIGIVVFVALVAIYRFLTPGYTPQPTDFTQAAPTTAKAPVQLAPQPTTAQSAPASAPAAVTAAPVQAVQQAQSAPQQMQGQPTNNGAPSAANPPANLAQGEMQQAPGGMPPMMQQQQGVQPTGNVPAQPMTVNDRVAAIEDQNAKLTNLLQIEYAQKMSEYAANEAAMQSKIQELNTRVAGMETIINQLNQLLQGSVKSSPMGPNAAVSAGRVVAQRISYVVQAIIPGRAWLKSDNGDTVTVAEGDSLKGYGRITKIDPYDGVVTVDTGSKTLTLSYGMGADSQSGG